MRRGNKDYALGRMKQGRMNKTEQAYANHLETLKQIGQIKAWWFEPEGLRLANRSFYHPDFRVMLDNNLIEFHEVKGFFRDDAKDKIKMAAEVHWLYRFVVVRKVKGGWSFEEI